MLRFTTRELILLITTVVVSGAWWSDHTTMRAQSHVYKADAYSWQRKAEAAKNVLGKSGWTVTWNTEGARFENSQEHLEAIWPLFP